MNHLLSGISVSMTALQIGHLLSLLSLIYFPQSLHIHKCPHGKQITLESKLKQIVHSFSSASAAPLITTSSPSNSSGADNP